MSDESTVQKELEKAFVIIGNAEIAQIQQLKKSLRDDIAKSYTLYKQHEEDLKEVRQANNFTDEILDLSKASSEHVLEAMFAYNRVTKELREIELDLINKSNALSMVERILRPLIQI